jgi:ATP-dependent DNA helicase RecQ
VRQAVAAAELTEAATPLFEALRAWRSQAAREQSVPAYIVFGDATLRAVATVRPRSLDDLAGITGIGAKKLETYGAALLEVVAASD